MIWLFISGWLAFALLLSAVLLCVSWFADRWEDQ